MVLTLLQAPAAPPVSLADAKAHMRITHDGEDDLIADLISAADAFLADDAAVTTTRRQWRLALSDVADRTIQLPRHPVIRIVAVTVFDADGAPAVLDGAAYALDMRRRPATLTVDSDVFASDHNGIEIDFEAGFGDTGAEVPDGLRRALLTLVAHWYEFRGVYTAADQPVSVPMVYSRLVRPWRRIGL